MVSRMKWKLFAVLLCTLVIAGCGNGSSSSYEQKNDDVYVMLKEEDLYIKYPDKEAEKVASDISEDSFRYIDGKGLMYLDEEGSLYLYAKGEKEKIAKNVNDSYDAYSVSQNGSTIAYLSDEDELYALFDGAEKIKVASDIYYYSVSSDGKLIYYVNEDDDLFCFTSDEKKDKIASDVQGYFASEDGSKVTFYTEDDELYIRDLNDDVKTKVLTDEDLSVYIDIDNNGDLAYMSEYDFDDDKGELYFKSGEEENSRRIASDVTSYHKQDDTFYYLDVDGKLYTRSVEDEKSEKLAEGVQEFYVAGNKVYYIDEDDNLFLLKKAKKEKIGIDIENGSEYEVSIIGEDIAYLTKDQELFLNKEKISANVESYVAYVDKLVYRTSDDTLHAVSANKPDKKETFENPDSYSSIFYSNQLVYESILSADDLIGIWEMKDDYDEGFIEISQNENYDDYLDFTFYDSYEIDDENEVEITAATSTTITVEDGLLFTKVSDDEWEISEVGDDVYYTLTKSTNEKLSDFIEEIESAYEEESDSYYDEYESYYDESDSYYDDSYYDDYESYDDEEHY